MTILHIPSWFPHAEKPLDGNFILRQIAAVSPHTTSIVLHHTTPAFRNEVATQMGDKVVLFPMTIPDGLSKMQMFRAYNREMRNVIRQYGKPDLIHLHVALPMGMLAVWLSIRYRIPLVVSEHWSGYQPQNRQMLTRLQRLQLSIIFRRAALLTTVSEDLHKSIMETIPSARKTPYCRVSNVVNTNVFTPGVSQLPTDEKHHIVHVSSLENASKNIMGALRTLLKLHDLRDDFVFDIIHDLRNLDAERFIEEHNMKEYVRLLGRKSSQEVAEYIRRSAFMLQFSNYETQSCVLLESFACGKPVLATRVGGIPEIVDSTRGRLVQVGNEEELLENLDFMLDHYEEFNQENIRQYAEQTVSTEQIGQEIFAQYQRLVNRPK